VPARLAYRRECPHFLSTLPLFPFLFSYKTQRANLVSVDAGS
jgi:hypothetical protein